MKENSLALYFEIFVQDSEGNVYKIRASHFIYDLEKAENNHLGNITLVPHDK